MDWMSYTWKRLQHYFKMDFLIFIPQYGEQPSKSIRKPVLSVSNALLARFMPPTSPVSPEFPCISIVFARTIVHGEDHGINPFVLQLHDGNSMTSGVAIKCTTIRISNVLSG